MRKSEERLRGELRDVLDLIRRAGGGVVFEDFPGALEDVSKAEATGDNTSTTRRSLIDEADRLAEALDGVRGEEGEWEAGEGIR
jgi:hypothetical protein